MDILEIASNIIIPKWVKAIVTATLAALIVAYSVMVFIGLDDSNEKHSWIEAAAYVLGILLPIFLVGIVILYAETGIDALRHRSYKYLTNVIPERTLILEPLNDKFAERTPLWRARIAKQIRSTSVRFQPTIAGDSVLYEVIAPTDRVSDGQELKKVKFLIQLNVRKANIVLFLPSKKFPPIHNDVYSLTKLFPHSMAGAAAEDYEINETPNLKTLRNTEYLAFVLIKHLPEKFMIQSAERLYFAQDVMFMLRAILNEAPDLFDDPSPEEIQRHRLTNK